MSKKHISIAMLSLTMAGCSGMGPAESTGTAVGAAGGAVVGAAVGDGVGAGVGAVTGAVVGNAVGSGIDADNRRTRYRGSR